MKYTVSVDLGQMNDFTAISILEEVLTSKADPSIPDLEAGRRGPLEFDTIYNLRHLERPALRTPYPDIVDRIKEIMAAPALEGKAILVVDATGVGRPVLDMMRREGLSPIGITITGGKSAAASDDGYHIPKLDLAMALQVLFGSSRLKIAKGMALTEPFIKEMEAFQAKIKANGTASYEAWRESDHDDLVLSVAMAAWWVLRTSPGRIRAGDQAETAYECEPQW